MVKLTPGSRRKLLRHINDGLGINKLAIEMGISSAETRKAILADDELNQSAIKAELVDEKGVFYRHLISDDFKPSLKKSFVRKVIAKQMGASDTDCAKPARPLPVVDVSLFFKATLVRLSGDPVDRFKAYGKPAKYRNKPSVREIINYVIRDTHFSYDDIVGKSRSKGVTETRHKAIAMTVSIRPDLSLINIGRMFGGRHHTTIMHAARTMGVPDRMAFGGNDAVVA